MVILAGPGWYDGTGIEIDNRGRQLEELFYKLKRAW